MSNFKMTLAYLPLLSILAISPDQMMVNKASRSIASVEEKVESFPKYKFYSDKVDHKSLQLASIINLSEVQNRAKVLKEKLEKKDSKDSLDLLKELVIVQDELKILKDKKAVTDLEEVSVEESIIDMKALIEPTLPEIQKPSSQMNVSITVVEDKKEEVKKEEPKEEVKQVQEEKKEEKKDESCAQNDQYKVLSQQVDQLVADQKNMMQALINLTQALTNMTQQKNNNSFSPMPYNQLYNYYSPTGNWVFYPNGQQPAQLGQDTQLVNPQIQQQPWQQQWQQTQMQQPQFFPQSQYNFAQSQQPSWGAPTGQMQSPYFQSGNFGAGMMANGFPIL